MDPQSLDPGSLSWPLNPVGDLWEKFGSPVMFSDGRGLKEFFLVGSIGRCKFRRDDAVIDNDGDGWRWATLDWAEVEWAEEEGEKEEKIGVG